MLSVHKELAAHNGLVWKDGAVIKPHFFLHETVLARDRMFSKLLDTTLHLLGQTAWCCPAGEMYGKSCTLRQSRPPKCVCGSPSKKTPGKLLPTAP